MALSNTTIKAFYSGDGADLTFAIPFTPIVDDSAETLVYIVDNTNPLAVTLTLKVEGIGNDYTLTGAPDADSFHTTVTFNTAPSATQKVVVIRALPLTQTLDMSVSGFRPPSIELQLDRAIAMIQQLNEMLTRVPLVDVGENLAAPLTLPRSIIGEEVIRWNAAGTALEIAAPDGTDAILELIGDVTAIGPNTATATIAADVVDNTKLANMATATFKGRTTGGTGDPEDLTVTQATALLNNFVGDSGAGGTKGLVPAPSAGDAALLKVLMANGTWVTQSGGAGGGSLEWSEQANAPIKTILANMPVYEFTAALAQQLYVVINVPSTYLSGNPIKLRLKSFNADTSGTVLLLTTTTLIRAEVDDYDSTTNTRVSTNAAITMTASNDKEPQKLIFDITSATGQVNAVSVTAGDILIVRLYRDTDTATSPIYTILGSEEITLL